MLDSREKKKLFIGNSDYKLSQIKTLSFGSSRFCLEQTVYVKPDIRDKLYLMDAALLVKLIEPKWLYFEFIVYKIAGQISFAYPIYS